MKRTLAMILALCIMLLCGCGAEASVASISAQQPTASSVEPEPPVQEPEPAVQEHSEVESIWEQSAIESQPEESEAVEIGLLTERPQVELPLCDGETLTMWRGAVNRDASISSYSENTVYAELEKRTGVTIEFTEVPPPSMQEQFSLMVASQDYTDIMDGIADYVSSLDVLVDSEIVTPLNSYLEEYAPSYNYLLNNCQELSRASSTDDGTIPGFSLLRVNKLGPSQGLVIRGDWVDQLGLRDPKTYDQMHDVLTEIKNAGLCEYPLAMEYVGTFDYGTLAQGYGVRAHLDAAKEDYYIDETGSVQFGPIQDGFREYLEMIHAWYEEGLVTRDLLPNSMMSSSDVLSGKYALWFDVGEFTETYASMASDPAFCVRGISEPVQNEGDILALGGGAYYNAAAPSLYVSFTSEKPELAISFLDYCFSVEGSAMCNYGIEGEGMEYDSDGYPHYSSLITDNPEGLTFTQCTIKYTLMAYGVIDDMRLQDSYSQNLLDSIACWRSASQPSDNDYISLFTMSVEESEEYSALYNNILTYASECVSQFIVGEKPLDEWDNYVAEIKTMGIDTCVAHMQAAYTRYKTRG